jgi:hypothetical protein
MSGIAQEQAEALAEQLRKLYPAWNFTPAPGPNGWVVQSRHRAISGKSMPVTSREEFEQHQGRHDGTGEVTE